MRVTFLTVGEYPAPTGLHASQVLPFASYLGKRGVRVDWIAFVPIEMWLRDLFVSRGAILDGMRRIADEQGVAFTVTFFPLTLIRVYSYIFRNWLIPSAGKRLFRILQQKNDLNGPHVVHCRSYFAAAVALEARNMDRNILVSFDMRSLLPPEVPLMFSRIGPMLYGGLKRWESSLLRAADCSFLPSRRGIELLAQDGVERLPVHINIAGFEDSADIQSTGFCSTNRVFGYIGGFGPWQSKTVLEKVFAELAVYVTGSSFEVITPNQMSFTVPVNVHSMSHHEVRGAILGMRAVLVPGIEKTDCRYKNMVSSYLFSTKAAEALSLGIPLIVNAQIHELADYVRSNGCGLVFSINGGRVMIENIHNLNLNDPDEWWRMNKSAKKCAPEFISSNVFDRYIKLWESMLVAACNKQRSSISIH